MRFPFWVCVISWFFGFSAGATATFSKEHIVILQKLEAKKFFKTQSCRQIADASLRTQGLPVIGDFRRLSVPPKMDRSRATLPLPTLSDQIGDEERKFLAQVKMFSVKQKGSAHWSILIARELAGTSAETVITFTTSGVSDAPTCRFKNLTFKTKHVEIQNRTAAQGAVLDVEGCLDVYAQKPVFSKTESEDQARTLYGWLKSDCEFALQFYRKPGH